MSMPITTAALIALALGSSDAVSTASEPNFSPVIFYGECEIHVLVDDARLAAAEAYPLSWETLLRPAELKEVDEGIRLSFRLPREWVGGGPIVLFDAKTCKIISMTHEQ